MKITTRIVKCYKKRSFNMVNFMMWPTGIPRRRRFSTVSFRSRSRRRCKHPTPHTIHPASYTLHPTFSTPHPTPCIVHPTLRRCSIESFRSRSRRRCQHPTPHTIHPAPYAVHPTVYTLHPTVYTLHPTPHTLHPTHYTSTIFDRVVSKQISSEVILNLNPYSEFEP